MIASQASSSPASRAPEADGRLCMDLNVDNGACPGWSWEGDARMASPTRLEVRSRAEGSPEGSGASCPVPGDAVAPAGSRGSFWSRSAVPGGGCLGTGLASPGPFMWCLVQGD